MKLPSILNCLPLGGEQKPSPTEKPKQAATAFARPRNEPPLIHKKSSSSSFLSKYKSLNKTWSSIASSIGEKSFSSKNTSTTLLSSTEQAAADHQKIGAQAIQELVVSGAHLAEIWNPLRIEHVLGLAKPVMKAEFSVLKETRITSLKGFIEQGAAGAPEGKSPLRTTTTNLKSLEMLGRFTEDPDLLDLAESARKLLEMPISEADGKDKELVIFRAFGDTSVFESSTKLGNGFDSKAHENLGHALNKISELGERSAALLKQKFPEHLSPHTAQGGRSAGRDKKGPPIFPRQLHSFFHRHSK